MELEIGHYYKTREGYVVGPMEKNPAGGIYPYYAVRASDNLLDGVYTASGKYWDDIRDSPKDLVEDLGLFPPILGLSSAEELAAKVRREHPYLKLLDTDKGFRRAALELEEKLAHALLAGGYALRRKKQSPQLFMAACHLLARRGVNICLDCDHDYTPFGVSLFGKGGSVYERV